jgi:hypothetical protein
MPLPNSLLASLNRRSEYVRIISIIISELEFGNVQMQIFLADLMECSDDAALQNGPEAFDRVRMNCANNVLADGMVDGLVRETTIQPLIAGISVSAEKADAVRYCFAYEGLKREPVSAIDNASDDIPLAFDRAHDRSLAGISAPALTAFLVPMPVLIATADVGFINLDDPAEFLDVLDHGSSDLMAHEPSCLVAAEAHIAEDLQGAHALLADQHQVRDSVPIFERLIRVLKDCAGQVRESIAINRANFALPMMAGCERIDLGIAATRAGNPRRPAANYQICNAIVLGLKQRVELRRSQLMDGLWMRRASHDDIPLSLRGI